MENSIHELIAALHPASRVSQSENPLPYATLPPFPSAPEDAPTDEDDDTNRPTAADTEASDERTSQMAFADIESPAPVEIIRGLASEFLDHQSPKERQTQRLNAIGGGEDIVSKAIVTEAQAQQLLDM